MATNEEMLVIAFQEKMSIRSDSFYLIWHTCSAMSANDLITCSPEQTISKWLFSDHFEFE